MKTRKLRNNDYAVSNSIEFSISSVALISAIAIITISVSVAPTAIPCQEHVDVDAKAQEISNILLSPATLVGLSVDCDTFLEEPSNMDLPGNTIQDN